MHAIGGSRRDEGLVALEASTFSLYRYTLAPMTQPVYQKRYGLTRYAGDWPNYRQEAVLCAFPQPLQDEAALYLALEGVTPVLLAWKTAVYRARREGYDPPGGVVDFLHATLDRFRVSSNCQLLNGVWWRSTVGEEVDYYDPYSHDTTEAPLNDEEIEQPDLGTSNIAWTRHGAGAGESEDEAMPPGERDAEAEQEEAGSRSGEDTDGAESASEASDDGATKTSGSKGSGGLPPPETLPPLPRRRGAQR